MSRRTRASACVLLACALGPAAAHAAAPRTPAGWRVEPAGTEIPISQAAVGFQGPLGAALSPDGRRLLAASSGAARIESADLFDLERRQRTSYVGYDATTGQSAFYGVAWSPDGRRAWVSGGGQGVLHALSATGGVLTETGTIAAGPFAAGLAYGRTPRGVRLYVANNLSGPAGRATRRAARSR
jgi:sugar lactone lactonase YvrE